MKRKITKWVFPALFAVLLLFAVVTPVLAIDDPDSISINAVYAYRNCRQDGDQLYLIDYTLDYSVTGEPSETVTEAFLCRLMNGVTELRAVAPYAYYNDGYDRGVIAVYFSAADAPAWEGSYTMYLIGNPILSWDADPLSASVGTFNLWQDNDMSTTQTVLSSRILYLADILEIAWSVDMIESTAGGHSLTTYGEDYFTNAVPYLSEIASYAFAGQTITPEIGEIDTSTDYADDLETASSGTLFDFTDLGTAFGTTRGVITALLYYGVVLFALIKISNKLQTYKPIMMLSIPLVILGAFIGVPLTVTILAGFLSLGYIAWSLFYKPSTA